MRGGKSIIKKMNERERNEREGSQVWRDDVLEANNEILYQILQTLIRIEAKLDKTTK